MQHQSTPCPDCGYDLQGQETPRCPECGCEFASIPEMVQASEHATRVFERVLRWRIKIAYILGAGTLALSIIVALMFLSEYLDINLGFNPTSRSIPMGMLALLVASVASFVVGGLLSFMLLLQVVRYCFDRRIPAAQRRELIGTIPLLLFYLIPTSLAIFVAVKVFI